MGKRRRDLSRTEWGIMRICWEKGQSTARAVYDETLKEKKRSYQAVKTMLDRLVKKGYLERTKLGPIWLYKATVSRARVVAREIEKFAGSVLDNSVAPLLIHLGRKEKVSPGEIEALKKLIREKEDQMTDGDS